LVTSCYIAFSIENRTPQLTPLVRNYGPELRSFPVTSWL